MLSSAELEKLRNYLAVQPIRKAFLFGSYSRNEEGTESDIDLLIEFEQGVKRIGFVKFISIKLDLEEIFQKKVDLLEEGGISKYIAPAIEREKRLVYEKQA